ncbi:MAG TPA: DEAD/DEAH box helicase [Stellaceae bacterium]|nr:DEAD/DEAH box helicase [Stellaceae bacterium]
MIPLNNFFPLVCAAIPRFANNPPNPHQQACIINPATEPLMIVAGPGSGKTTVLVLRALRFVFVDRILPEHIILTTFTRKAAKELRSRLIDWGLLLCGHLRGNPPIGQPGFIEWLASVDVNRFVTGTLDSLCEEVLNRYRDPTDRASVVVEGFVANALLRNDGLYPVQANRNPLLSNYLASFTFEGNPPRNFGELLAVSRTFIDRFLHDEVNVAQFRTAALHGTARQCLVDAADSYWQSLDNASRLDFARLEHMFYARLVARRLSRFTSDVRAVLVDEYQDTNPLQERIYFELVRQTNASLTIVGDDDQSLYRFRGATIELFRDFVANFRASFPGGTSARVRHLIENYRSTPEIVRFFNDFIDTDSAFAAARVQPPKPRIQHQLRSNGCPVLGLFRPDRHTLASDLTTLLTDIFCGTGRQLTITGATVNLCRNVDGGDFGDCVFLGRTVNEYARGFGNAAPRPRLPFFLRQGLSAHGVQVFNPRGSALRDILVVQQLLGVLLHCIDPPTRTQPDGAQLHDLIARNALRQEAVRYLTNWRRIASAFMASNPMPNRPHMLSDFVQAWQQRRSQSAMRWPEEWPLLEICFKIVSWITYLRDDPEGQVYLESICRVVSQASTFSSYRSNIVFDDPGHHQRSVQRAITDMLAPIAEDEIELDEDVMPSVPRDRLSFMTIHQAKGLEFPLVIVDVGSDFSRNHPRQRFSRFPENASNVAVLEDELSAYCPIGRLRLARTSLDRTFDDLVRLNYVAFSRPQSVLLLVGLDACLQYNSAIKNVATGWRRDQTWAWRVNVSGRPPPLANRIPLHLI